jgi:hypothetical protein
MFHMRQRKILGDNDGLLVTVDEPSFERGTIRERWESYIEREKWFDPGSTNLLIRN